jgi:hypothetical protein
VIKAGPIKKFNNVRLEESSRLLTEAHSPMIGKKREFMDM